MYYFLDTSQHYISFQDKDWLTCILDGKIFPACLHGVRGGLYFACRVAGTNPGGPRAPGFWKKEGEAALFSPIISVKRRGRGFMPPGSTPGITCMLFTENRSFSFNSYLKRTAFPWGFLFSQDKSLYPFTVWSLYGRIWYKLLTDPHGYWLVGLWPNTFVCRCIERALQIGLPHGPKTCFFKDASRPTPTWP